jgi:anti-sigma regulatory factor (Ser/Thr protein kinase)
MNAIEHGNHNRAEIPVEVEVLQKGTEIVIAISDSGGGPAAADYAPANPDLASKLAGQQSPRGWGLFLIRNMVDAMDVTTEGARHTVTLTMRTGAPEAEGAGHDEHV